MGFSGLRDWGKGRVFSQQQCFRKTDLSSACNFRWWRAHLIFFWILDERCEYCHTHCCYYKKVRGCTRKHVDQLNPCRGPRRSLCTLSRFRCTPRKLVHCRVRHWCLQPSRSFWQIHWGYYQGDWRIASSSSEWYIIHEQSNGCKVT